MLSNYLIEQKTIDQTIDCLKIDLASTDILKGSSYSVQSNATVVSGAKNFNSGTSPLWDDSDVDVANSEIIIPAHGYFTGLKGQLTTDGTLPDGLNTGTDYFVIVVNANRISFATSLQNALNGVKVILEDHGSSGAENTFTPTALTGGSIQLFKSNDGVNFIAHGNSTAITASGTFGISEKNPEYRYWRMKASITTGSILLNNFYFIKDNAR